MKALKVLLFSVMFLSITTSHFSCNRGKKITSEDENFGKYISAHTTGLVSKSSSIFVQFHEKMVADSLIGLELDGKYFSFYPKIEGVVLWQDDRTLLFRPSEYMNSGTEYKVSVDLKLIFDKVPDDIRTAEFKFQTRYIQFHIQREELTLNAPNFVNYKLVFKAFASDIVDPEDMTQFFQITGSNNEVLNYEIAPDGLQNLLITIPDYKPTGTAANIRISWKELGKIIAKDFYMPGSDGFVLFDHKIENDGRTYIKLVFNKMLDANQKLDGLISIPDEDVGLSFVKGGNVVRIYFDKPIFGNKIIKLNGSLRNSNLEDLGEDKLLDIYFHDFDPKIELLGRGHIVPTNNGVIFPFKTINLTAVDVEIVKIFPNNILQYLQSNESDYRIDEVGRIVYQNKIDLEKVAGQMPLKNNWETYALDLADFVDMQTNAIYQVRLGFRPGYVMDLDCTDPELEEVKDLTLKRGDQEIESFYDNNYYGLLGYRYGYWEDRATPCKISFYNNSKFVKRNVFASNLGIMVKSMENGHYNIFCTHLLKAEPVAEVNISLYDFQQQLIISGKTNINGEVDLKPVRQPKFVTASFGKDNSFMRIFDGEGLSMTSFDISGISPQQGLKGYFFGERDIWRPGDSVFMNLIVESSGVDIVKGFTVDVTVVDPLGRQFFKKTYFKQELNMFSFPFHLPQDALTGNWRLTAKIGGSEFSRNISVETIKPNRYSLDLELPEIIYKGDNLNVNAQVNWLTGGTVPNSKVRVEKKYLSRNFFSEKHKDYSFNGWTYQMNETPELLTEQKTDQDGKINFQLDLEKLVSVPGVVELKYNIKAFEESGNFSNFNRGAKYYAYDKYIGVKVGKKRYRGNYLTINQSNMIDVVLVDKKSNPIANRELKVKIYFKENYYWWSNNTAGSLQNYIESRGFNLHYTTSVTTDKNGRASTSFSPIHYGTHVIVVEGDVSEHSAFVEAHVGYGGGENAALSGSTIIEILNVEKEVEIGKEISLKIPADNAGNFLITIENNKGIVDRFWQKASQGDNIVKFRATNQMTPTIYVNIYHYQPHNTLENDNPIRMYGVVPIQVYDPARHLNPVIQTVKRIEPGAKFNIKVSEKDKKQMAYSIAIVDEGLLSLTSFETPDPFKYFNAKEALSTKTWDLYDEVLGAYGARISRIFGIGGDGKAELSQEDSDVSRFPPVVKFLGPFYLAGGKTASHNITMPNYIGNLRVMVVASDQHAFGKSQENVTVSSELMVLSTMPRQLSPKSLFKIPVTIFTDGKNSRNVTVKVEDETNSLKFPNGKVQTFKAKAKGVETVYFDAQTTNATGISRLKVTAESENVNISEFIDIKIDNPNPVSRKFVRKVIKPNEKITLPLEALGSDVKHSVNIIELSSLMPFGIKSWTDGLIRYPHGCLEQITSIGIGQIALPSFAVLTTQESDKVTLHINSVINRMRSYATVNGGFSYWPSNREVDLWSTSYAGEFLVEANKRGYKVPIGMLENWKKSQRNLARMWVRNISIHPFYNDQNEMTQAYRLYTLALAEVPELPAMNKLRETTNLSTEARILLSMAYSLSGNKTIGAKLLENLPKMDKDKYNQSYGLTYGSSVRDIALLMKAYALADKLKEAENLIIEINLMLQQNRWTTTQDKAQIMMAFEAYGETFSSRGQLNVSYQIEDGNITTVDVAKNAFILELPMTEYNKKTITLTNNSEKNIFVDHLRSGKMDVGEDIKEEDRSKYSLLKLSTRYFDMNNTLISPENLVVGQEFYIESTIENASNFTYELKELALTITVPDGWEIINERVNFNSATDNKVINYVDIRDNRITTYFNINAGKKVIIKNRLIASFEGDFYLPAAVCESMYLKNIYAATTGKWVKIKNK